MKPVIISSTDALAFLLRGLYNTETTIKETLPSCFSVMSSEKVKRLCVDYSANADHKLLKLERVFNYLMTEPITRKNEAIQHLVGEMHQILSATALPHLRDMLGVGYLQNINTYKISCYRSAYLFAVELELDTAADLIEQILGWELETSHVLSQLALDVFTRQQSTSNN